MFRTLERVQKSGTECNATLPGKINFFLVDRSSPGCIMVNRVTLGTKIRGITMIASIEDFTTTQDTNQGEDMGKKKADTPEASKPPEANGKTLTQREMVEAAIAAGISSKSNVDLANWIQEHHKVTLKPQQIANVKQAMSKGKQSAIIKTGAPRARAEKPAKVTSQGDALELVLKVNQLIEECGGKDRLVQLVEVIGK